MYIYIYIYAMEKKVKDSFIGGLETRSSRPSSYIYICVLTYSDVCRCFLTSGLLMYAADVC